jgi:hypothetical protein
MMGRIRVFLYSFAVMILIVGLGSTIARSDPSVFFPFSSGWNFFSLPLSPPDTSISKVLGPVSSKVIIVWGYDNAAKTWKRWRPDHVDNTLSTLEPGNGYWVFMTEAASMDISTWTTVDSPSIPLAGGWNLAGYRGSYGEDIATALAALFGKWSILWTWENGQWYAKHATTTVLPLPIQPFSVFTQGKAYWVKISEGATWAQNRTNAADTASVRYLSAIQDQFHSTFLVYSDADAAGNHFAARGMLKSAPVMQEAWSISPHSGNTCIRCEFKSGSDWGGWYLMNGVLQGSARSPSENWGNIPNAGVDLRGATALTFWAKGEKGGERVEFFAFGVGYDANTNAPITGFDYRDSSTRVSTGMVTLASTWTKYTISLAGRDLSYVLGGFGWVASAAGNEQQDIVFYLDDIAYDKPRITDPRFLVSYETQAGGDDFDRVLRNVAFTYDNAVALIAFLAAGEKDRAKLIADAFVYAQNHDRYYSDQRSDGRLRNA